MTILAAIILAAAPASANQAILSQLRDYDQRVGTIGYQLAERGVALCPQTVAPLAGLRVHTLGQYGRAIRKDAQTHFGLGDYPAVLTVAPGSAALAAGLERGDWIISINGADLRSGPGYQGVARFDAMLAEALAKPPARLEIERAGARRQILLAGKPGCASVVELIPSGARNAAADGTIVQITTAVLEETRDDDELAFIVAHEMAHNILQHRMWLDRIGRSTRNIRATETEADLLAVRLLKGAGFDPLAASRFWARFGRKTGLGIFSDGTHMRTRPRVRMLYDEAIKLTQ